MQIVTSAQAREQIRIDTGADDGWLAIWIPAISQAVLTWLKEEWRLYEVALDSNGQPIVDSAGDPYPALDSSGDPIVRPIVQAAVLVELAQQYRFRDGSDAQAVPSHWGHGYVLGAGATSLLAGLRKSTVA